MSRFDTNIDVTHDKDGLVITTAQRVLHVTCMNGLPYVWFNDTLKGWGLNRPTIRGMTPEGAAFRESAGTREKTFEELLEREKLEWERQYILSGTSPEEREAAVKEYAEMKGGKILEEYLAGLARAALSRKNSEERAKRKAYIYEGLLQRHPVGSKFVMRGKNYHIKEYSWESIRLVQLGAYDIETSKEIDVLKYVVLAQDMHVDTSLASAYLSGDKVPEEEQHGNQT